jgi:hypothetical protein
VLGAIAVMRISPEDEDNVHETVTRVGNHQSRFFGRGFGFDNDGEGEDLALDEGRPDSC